MKIKKCPCGSEKFKIFEGKNKYDYDLPYFESECLSCGNKEVLE